MCKGCHSGFDVISVHVLCVTVFPCSPCVMCKYLFTRFNLLTLFIMNEL